jgi:hypothetical protein
MIPGSSCRDSGSGKKRTHQTGSNVDFGLVAVSVCSLLTIEFIYQCVSCDEEVVCDSHARQALEGIGGKSTDNQYLRRDGSIVLTHAMRRQAQHHQMDKHDSIETHDM